MSPRLSQATLNAAICGKPPYSTLMPANLITFAHFSTASVRMVRIPRASRSAPGRADARKAAGLITSHEISHCRDIRQHVQSGRGRDPQRPQLAGPDVLDRRWKGPMAPPLLRVYSQIRHAGFAP